jgi:hypothetical protein
MKPSVFVDEEQLVDKAMKLLVDGLGPVETGRFLSLPRRKRAESVERHQRWQAHLDKEEFFGRVFDRKNT